mmetsp:Transcript_26275/g.39782  ORF Transcript_26275/g.39782 Transcript_26275/m.39782 type:complete len:720 (+) Transcript_26275:119-2278(+)
MVKIGSSSQNLPSVIPLPQKRRDKRKVPPQLRKKTKARRSPLLSESTYPLCIVILLLQSGLILFISFDSDIVPPTNNGNEGVLKFLLQKPNRKKYGSSLPLFQAEERPDIDLPNNIKIQNLEYKIKEHYNLEHVQSCRWFRRSTGSKRNVRIVNNYDCERETLTTEMVLYNPLEHERFMCNRTIPGKTFVRIEKPFCGETEWRLFRETPVLENAKKLPPITILPLAAEYEFKKDEFLEGSHKNDEKVQKFECDVGCQKVGTKYDMAVDQTVVGTNLRFRYSMESIGNYDWLNLDKTAHKNNLFYATTSFASEIPLPYFSFSEYKIQAPAVDYDKAIRGASFLASNCWSKNNRESIVKEMIELMRVDSLGACLHNAEPPNGLENGVKMSSKKSIQAQYLFHLAFENTNEIDYVTEKLWGTYESGTLPVYMGAPNIKEHAVPNSIISWHDFDSTKALVDYLKVVANNKTLYESYQLWRKNPLPQSFLDKFDFTHIHSVCRMCRFVHAREYGYNFDHKTQSIQEPAIQRSRFCTDNKSQLISYPLKEQWVQAGEVVRSFPPFNDKADCYNSGKSQKTNVGSWTRIISNWDGAVDIQIVGTGEDALYQLETPIRGSKVDQKSPQMWQWQDSKSRATLVTNWPATLQQEKNTAGVDPSTTTVNISLRNIPRSVKIRVIFEDIDTFHLNGDKESNFFGQLLAMDLLVPMERFLTQEKNSKLTEHS